MLIYKSYIYNLHSKSVDVKRFRCTNRSCNGSISILKDEIKELKHHTHEADTLKSQQLQLKFKINENSFKGNESIEKVIVDAMYYADKKVIVEKFPSIKNIKDNIKKKQNKLNNYTNIQLNDIPDILRKDLNGDLFLHYDSGIEDKNRFIIFFSKFKKQKFANKNFFLLDGTFKSAPIGFYQILTISSIFLGKTFPFIYVLMSGKTESEYIKVFETLKQLFDIKIKCLVCDFEKAITNAILSVYESVNIQLCFFHYGQSLWKRIQNEGLTINYKKNEKFKETIRMLLCLPFVCENNIISTFNIIKEQFAVLNEQEKIEKFIAYYIKTYLGNKNINLMPIFDCKYWSIYNSIKLGLPRTNNTVESLHAKINKKMKIRNPNIAHFIQTILEIERCDELKIIQFINGGNN